MAGRTPSFVVVGLVMIMFLLGFFYISCSTKTTELRQTLEEFEDRIRTLTVKNSDNERKIETIMTRKRELEEENTNIQRKIEKKESEINDLNTKYNMKQAEYQTLQTDNQVLDGEMRDYKNISQLLSEKTLEIKKLKKEFEKQNRNNTELVNQLRQEIENYKNQPNNQVKPPLVPNQRFQPLLSPNETMKNTSSVFQEPLAKLSNITNEIKENIKEKVYNRLGIGDNLIVNQNQRPNSPDVNERLRRSSNDSILDNKSSNNTDINTAQKTLNLASNALGNETHIANNQSNVGPSQLIAPEKNYRIDNREQIPPIRKNIEEKHQQPLDNGQEVINKNNHQQNQKLNIL